jgi:hypothetical protein
MHSTTHFKYFAIGFESDGDKRKDSTSLIGPQPATIPSRQQLAMMTYWADDHSLWNPNVITPDPLMETPTSSFSITYLEDNPSRAAEYNTRENPDEESPNSTLDSITMTNPDLNLSIPEAEPAIQDDDVFF